MSTLFEETHKPNKNAAKKIKETKVYYDGVNDIVYVKLKFIFALYIMI